MFEMSVVKLLLVVLVAASLGAFWYMDTLFHQWDQVLPQPEEMIVETVPESSKNDTTLNKSEELEPTNEWQIITGGIQLNIIILRAYTCIFTLIQYCSFP